MNNKQLNKIMAVALVLCCVMLTGCKADEPSTPNIGISNPMVSVDTADAFLAAGVSIDAPDNASDVSYYIISGSIAGVSFTYEGESYTYRASALEKDISGIYYELSAKYVIQTACDGFTVEATVYSAGENGMLAKWEHDGVNYTLWHDGEIESEKLDAAVVGVMARTFSAAQTVQPSAPVEFSEAGEYTADIDGDGMAEKVSIIERSGYELGMSDFCTLTLTDSDGKEHSLHLDLRYITFAAAYDIDADGRTELFISGDFMSDDYVSYVIRYNGSELELAANEYDEVDIEEEEAAQAAADELPYVEEAVSFYGNIQSVGEGIIKVSQAIDMLGSHMGETYYVMDSSDFRFIKQPDAAWTINVDTSSDEAWEYTAITTAAEFPVRMDGTTEDATLPIGTSIIITEISGGGESYTCRFITRGGEEGTISLLYINTETEWGVYINGIAEADCFEYLPYAG